MTDLDAIARAWAGAARPFARVDDHPWGIVVADDRFPDLLICNSALVTSRTPVPWPEVDRAFRAAAPHAVRRSVVVFHHEEQTELLAAMGSEGGGLYFDRVLAAGPTPMTDTERVAEVREPDDDFWSAHAATLGVFGITEPRIVEQLRRAEVEVLRAAGKRWFAVRGPGGAIESLAALTPGEVAEIDHVATLPAARGRGNATALVARCVEEARAAGTPGVFLFAQPGGSAERLYRRSGFTIVGTTAGWPDLPLTRMAGAEDGAQPTNL